jgi:O-antigen ligase
VDLRRPSFDAAITVMVAVTVFLFALGTSSVAAFTRIGGTGKWVALFLLACVALAGVCTSRPQLRVLPPAWAIAAVLLALGAVSAGWSVNVRATEGRIVALVVLFATSAALAVGSPDRAHAARRVLDGVLAACALVAVGGLVVLLVAHRDAVFPATAAAGWRFKGLGQSPDTDPMLLAVGVPLALRHAVDGDRRLRWAAVALLLLFAGELAASGSRGGLAAGFGGGVVAAVALGGSRRGKVVLALAVLVVAALAVGLSRLPGPAASGAGSSKAPPPPRSQRGIDAQAAFPFDSEIGYPTGPYQPPNYRTLLGSSGRLQAWVGAWEQGIDRPLLGYGFGTEDRAFVDRFYSFHASVVENTYLGFFIQLGLLGVGLLLALLVTLAANGVATLGRAPRPTTRIAGAALGVLTAALLSGVSQSGLLTVGFVSAAAIWLCVLPLPVLARSTR